MRNVVLSVMMCLCFAVWCKAQENFMYGIIKSFRTGRLPMSRNGNNADRLSGLAGDRRISVMGKQKLPDWIKDVNYGEVKCGKGRL